MSDCNHDFTTVNKLGVFWCTKCGTLKKETSGRPGKPDTSTVVYLSPINRENLIEEALDQIQREKVKRHQRLGEYPIETCNAVFFERVCSILKELEG